MKSLVNFFKGIVISVSTLVPGVSGGTMAIILGIYDDLIHAIGSFFQDWRKHLILLLEVGIGSLIGLLAFSRVMEVTLNKFPILTGFFFIGVVCGGIPVLYRRAIAREKNKGNYIFLILGLIIALFMSLKPGAISTMATTGGATSFIFLIVAGFIMAIALILPGISGSFMLLLLGLYDITLNAINNFNVQFLIPLVIGLALGTILTTKAIETLLNKYPGKTYMLILGFVIGSIVPIYPGMPKGMDSIFAVISTVLGFLLIFFISRRENNLS